MAHLQHTQEIIFESSVDLQDYSFEEEEQLLEAPFGVVSAMYTQFRNVERIDPEIINLLKNKFK